MAVCLKQQIGSRFAGESYNWIWNKRLRDLEKKISQAAYDAFRFGSSWSCSLSCWRMKKQLQILITYAGIMSILLQEIP